MYGLLRCARRDECKHPTSEIPTPSACGGMALNGPPGGRCGLLRYALKDAGRKSFFNFSPSSSLGQALGKGKGKVARSEIRHSTQVRSNL